VESRGVIVLHFHERVRSATKMVAPVLVAASFLAASGEAYAQQRQAQETARCDCVTARGDRNEGDAVGVVTSATGRVNVTNSQGWATGNVGTQITLGGSVETGPSPSKATIRIGDCELEILEQRLMTVEPTDGLLCLALAQTSPGGISAAGIVVGGLAATALIVGIVESSTGDDRPVSP